jgi:hypothetical protein
MSDNNLVLLVGGRLTSGKDAFADHLVANHGFIKLGMSDVLAEALYTLNPWVQVTADTSPLFKKYIRQHVPIWVRIASSILFEGTHFFKYRDLIDELGYVDTKKATEARELLQRLGTEVGRELLGENIWVDAVKKKILDLQDVAARNEYALGEKIVVTGVRFPNELNLVEQLRYGGPVRRQWGEANSIWVERPSLPPLDPDPSKRHASEGSVKAQDFDYVLMNDGTLEDLYGAAELLLVEIEREYA